MIKSLLIFLFIWQPLSGRQEACSEDRDKCPSDENTDSDEDSYTPIFNLIGPETGKEDEAIIYKVHLSEFYRYGTLNFYIGIAEDSQIDLYSVGNMRLEKKGKNYECIENEMWYSNIYNDSESKLTKYMGNMNLGIVVSCVNAEDMASEENILLFEMAIYIMNNALKKSDEITFCVGAEIHSSVSDDCPSIKILPREKQPEKKISEIEVYLLSKEDKIKIEKNGIALIQYGINYGDGEGFFRTKIKVDVPPNSRLTICQVSLIRKGFNLPYVPKFYHNMKENENVTTELIIDLGRIHVTDQIKNNKSANELVLEVGFRSIGAVNSNGDVGIDGHTIPTPTIQTTLPASNEINLQPTPVNFFPSSIIVKSGETRVDFEFVLPSGLCYESFKLIELKFGNKVHMGKVCRLEVKDVGRSTPCVNVTKVNDKLQYWKSQLLVEENSIFDLNNVCVANQKAEQTHQNKLVVSVVAELQWILPPSSEDQYNVIADFTIGSRNYSYSTNMFYLFTEDDMTLDEDYPPSLQGLPQWKNPIPVKLSAILLIQIKIQPASRGIYKLLLTSEDSGLGICKVSIQYVGQNLPCVDPDVFPGDPDTNATTWINYHPHNDPNNGVSQVTLDFGSLANVGIQELVGNTRNDENTILLSVGLKVNSVNKDKKPYILKYKLTYNTFEVEDETEVETDAGTKTQSEKVDFTLERSDTNIFINVTRLITVNIKISSKFSGPLIVKFKSDVNNIFCCAAVTHVGINIPCLNASAVDIKMTPSEVILNLGQVCYAVSKFNEPESNLISIQTAVLINTKIVDPIPSKIGITVNSENLPAIQQQKIDLTLIPDKYTAEPSKLIKLTSLKDKITIPIGNKEWIPFDIRIPLFITTPLQLQIQAPVKNKRAILTIYDIRVLNAGLNVKCSIKMIYDVQLSCVNSLPSQNDVLLVNMDFITNTGFSRNIGNYSIPDDILTVEVLIRATDHPDIKSDEEYPLIITANNSSSIVQLITVTTDKTNKENILAELIISETDSKETYANGSNILFSVIIKHTNESYMEPAKALLVIFLPPFMNIKKFFQNSTHREVFSRPKNYASFEIDNFLFDEVIGINTELNIIPEKRKLTVSTTEVTLVARILCVTNSEPNPHLCALSSPIKIKLKPNICTDPLLIQPCQVSTSPAVEKLSDNLIWSPALQWDNNMNNWYQVNLGNLTLISRVEVVQIAPIEQTLSNYQLLTSFDGRSWNPSEKKLIVDSSSQDMDTLTTRFLRISISNSEIMSSGKQLQLHIKLYGCAISGDESFETTCEETLTTILTNDVTKYRHYSIDESHDIIYVCDTTVNKKILTCFCSYDKGSTWKGLPAYIKSIVGYSKEFKMIVAADATQKTLIKSHNCIEWMPTTNIDKLQPSVSVPGVIKTKLDSLPTFGNWKVDYDGIAYNKQLKFKWSNCCNK